MNIRNLFLAMLGIVFIACSTDNEELEFSCDRDIDEWARKNLTEIRKLTRENYLHIRSADYRSAVYAAFSPEQKRQFWIEKLQETLELDWNDKERGHIKSLLYFAQNSGIFRRELTKDDEIFEYKWTKYAEEELNWSDEIISSIGWNLYPVVNKTGEVRVSGNSVSALKTRSEYGSGGNRKSCDCVGDGDCTSVNGPGMPRGVCNTRNTNCDRKFLPTCGFLNITRVCNALCSYN
jgi:hypothetical protein